MRHLRLLSIALAIWGTLLPDFSGAAEISKFDGTETMDVGTTRLLINNFATYQCGWRLVFEKLATVRKKNGNIAFNVKTIPAESGECGCKARTNDFHLYRARRKHIDSAGYTIPDELVAKGRIGPSGNRSFEVAAIHRVERRFDYYINFDCTD